MYSDDSRLLRFLTPFPLLSLYSSSSSSFLSLPSICPFQFSKANTRETLPARKTRTLTFAALPHGNSLECREKPKFRIILIILRVLLSIVSFYLRYRVPSDALTPESGARFFFSISSVSSVVGSATIREILVRETFPRSRGNIHRISAIRSCCCMINLPFRRNYRRSRKRNLPARDCRFIFIEIGRVAEHNNRETSIIPVPQLTSKTLRTCIGNKLLIPASSPARMERFKYWNVVVIKAWLRTTRPRDENRESR